MSKNNRGFTLIELLVVVAIISLLVSILLPSLQSAKELAKSTNCIAKLKNLGVQLAYYTQENNGSVHEAYVTGTGPYWCATTGSNSSNSYVRRFLGMKYGETVGVTYNNGAFAEYSNPDGLLDCPTERSPYPGIAAWHYVNYGYNSEPWYFSPGASVETLKAGIIIYADCYNAPKLASTEHPGYGYAWDFSSLGGTENGPWYGHPGETANVVFIDGHCESLSFEDMTDDYWHVPGPYNGN